ncbi:uncharacterized protein LOC142519566 [Primulina tabacum]|uniref:uncharacterized protein LOC142519566 n=1 Tax=Primulina tabacum TaxID=48773 RepID=UPI003F5A3E3B
MAGIVPPSSNIDTRWILDTGANDHIVGRHGFLGNFKSYATATGSIQLPNGSTTKITNLGSMYLNKAITLSNDLSSGRIMGIGKESHGLYYLDNSSLQSSNVSTPSTLPASQFQLYRSSLSAGPFNTPTHHGKRFFITIVDDFTRSTWVYLMHSKLDVLPLIKRFLIFIKTQFSADVKTIRTDNAMEFCQQECSAIFHSLGILHQRSCPYTPQQNGLVERKHRHILNIARSLMFQASFPTPYWGFCVLASVYIINRTPTPLLSNKTPFEALFGSSPSYSHLRVLGCLCYVSTLPKGDKFAPRASACVFLGYSSNQKGYKVQDLTTKRFFVSRDIVFHEDIFPFSRVPDIQPIFSILDVPIPIPEPLPPPPHPQAPSPDHVPCPTRHSTRISRPPIRSHDYICSNSHSSFSCTHSLSNYVQYTGLSHDYRAFLSSFSAIKEPSTYHEAILDPRWQHAMDLELQALASNHTWEIVDLPQGKIPIANK